MNKILQKFGTEIAFLNRDDEYFNTSVPYSQYVLDDNTIYSPDGTDTGFAYDQQDNEEFYGVVFQDWAGIGTGTNSAFHFAYNQEAGGYSPTDPNNPYNDITNYDPTSDRIDILDLQGYMSVGNTLHGEGVYNGETIVGLTGNTQYGYDGKDEFEAIMNYERNYFQGDVPTLQKIEDIFGVDSLADLRPVLESCTQTEGGASCEDFTAGLGKSSVDDSGWQLTHTVGDQYHCGVGGLDESNCFKFINTDTGQEVIYSDRTDDGVFNPTIDLTTETGGTFNYDPGMVYISNHTAWDVNLWRRFDAAPDGYQEFAEPEARPILNLNGTE